MMDENKNELAGSTIKDQHCKYATQQRKSANIEASRPSSAQEQPATQAELDEKFMREALKEAHAAAIEGEVPVGAVVVADGQVIAKGHNRREVDQDPTAHAELRAMRAASERIGQWRLSRCTVYVTLEPCVMCAGLMVNARVARCVYGASDPKAGALGTLYQLNEDTRLNHSFEVTEGVMAEESSKLLKEFFANLRARTKEAIP